MSKTIYKVECRKADGEYTQLFADKATALYSFRVVSEDPDTIFASYSAVIIVSCYLDEEQLYFR